MARLHDRTFDELAGTRSLPPPSQVRRPRGWRSIGIGVALVLAYVMLFLVGASTLGPVVQAGATTPREEGTALVMTFIVAGIDTALMWAWLSRARARGLRLWLEAMIVLYGIKTFSSTLEVWYFVRPDTVPAEMLPHLFVMTLPLSIGWTGLAVWLHGRCSTPRPPPEPAIDDPRRASSLALRIALAGAILYPLLFFTFGYWVAWQNAGVRAYYGGPEIPLGMLAHVRELFSRDPWVLPFEMGRGMLWIALGWPVLRRTRGPWWVGGLSFAALLAVLQNDVHLLPNPLMPREVRVWHLIETTSSNFLFGLVTAALLAPTGAWARLREATRRNRAASSPTDRRFRTLAVALALLLSLGGLGGGALLWFDPSGAAIGLDLAVLASTPFVDFEIPGVVLFLANGVLPLAAGFFTATGHPRAPSWIAGAGAVLLGWMLAQLAWVGWLFWLQGVLLAWGVALLATGLAWPASRFVHRRHRLL
jgi:hypothetical protein